MSGEMTLRGEADFSDIQTKIIDMVSAAAAAEARMRASFASMKAQWSADDRAQAASKAERLQSSIAAERRMGAAFQAMRRQWASEDRATAEENKRLIADRAEAWERGVRQMERAGKTVFAGLAAATAVGIKALEHYGEKFESGKTQIEAFKGAVDELYTSIGRDLATGGAGGFLGEAIGLLSKGREMAVNGLLYAAGLGNQGAVIDAVTKQDEGMQKEFAAKRKFDAEKRGLGGPSGNKLQDDLARIDDWERAQKQKFGGMSDLSSNQRADLIGEAGAEADRRRKQAQKEDIDRRQTEDGRRRDEQAQAAEQQREREARHAEERQREKEKAAADSNRFASEEEMLRIEQMQRQGQREQAEAARIRLDYRRREQEIIRSSIPDEEKKARLMAMGELMDSELADAGKGGKSKFAPRGHFAMTGAAAVYQKAVEGSADNPAVKKMTDVHAEIKKVNVTLEKILPKIGDQVFAYR